MLVQWPDLEHSKEGNGKHIKKMTGIVLFNNFSLAWYIIHWLIDRQSVWAQTCKTVHTVI